MYSPLPQHGTGLGLWSLGFRVLSLGFIGFSLGFRVFSLVLEARCSGFRMSWGPGL